MQFGGGRAKGFSEPRYNSLALAIGACVGVVGAAFHLSLNWLVHAYSELITYLGGGVGTIVAAITLSAGMAVLAAYLVRRFAPEATGSGIQEIEGAIEGALEIRWIRVLWVKFTAGLLALTSGLVLGREGPTIHLGAAVAKGLSDFFEMSDQERRGLLAAGAAAGLAAAFNAPLAAVLFITEEMQRIFPFRRHTYSGLIIASIAAAVIAALIAGEHHLIDIAVTALPLKMIPFAALLGCAISVCAVAFNRALLMALSAADRVPDGAWWAPAAILGGGSGLLMVVFPDAVYGGEVFIRQLTAASLGVAALLALSVLRFSGSVLSYTAGTPGGIFAPMLAIAASIGLTIGVITNGVFPDVPNTQTACAILAMGAFFSASVRAPVVATVLVLELTGAYSLLLPLMVACICASLLASFLRSKPIYQSLLQRKLDKQAMQAG